jgi:hypothetical protein
LYASLVALDTVGYKNIGEGAGKVCEHDIWAGRYDQKMKELQLDSLETRRQLADMVMVYKIMHGHGDLDPEDLPATG